MIVVTGGSGSGKSAYAEKQILQFGEMPRYYIATMENRDAESQKRVDRHRAMRADKKFVTVECPYDLQEIQLEKTGAVLLECMSNLVANELFIDFNCKIQNREQSHRSGSFAQTHIAVKRRFFSQSC